MNIMSLHTSKCVRERRKYEIKSVLKQGIALVMCLSILICVGMSALSVNAEKSAVSTNRSAGADEAATKTVNEILNNEIRISLTEKISLKELEEQFPEEMEVICSDGSKETISVTWQCECDYEKEEYNFYVFEVVLSAGYMMSGECPSAFILVTLEGYEEPEVYRVYEPNPDSTVTIDKYLGVTKDVAQFLDQYDPDENGNYSTYFLSTPYYENLNNVESNLKPNGEGADGKTSGMNCVGFVGSVLRYNGADLTKVTKRLPGWYANASNWNDFVDTYHIKSYRFTSISEMLKSGKLQKGDIIYFEPTWANANDDCHMGFFWGNTSDEDVFWNSSKDPWGNWITPIKSKSPIYYIYVFPVSHETGDLEIHKKSSDPELTEGNPTYSLAGAVYGVYFRDRVYDEPEYTITLDENGYGKLEGIPKGDYYIKELVAPPGYELDESWYPGDSTPIYVSPSGVATLNVTDVPIEERGNVKIMKYGKNPDDETHIKVPLKGITFVFTSKKDGTTYVITTDENGEASTEVLGGIPCGTYTVTEENTPDNYVPCEAFEVTVSNDGNLMTYEIDNEEIMAAIAILKKDAETKDTIKVSGTEFRILDSEKEPILEHLVTDEYGKAVLPERLPCGTYYLEEVKAPKGYLKGEFLEFAVTEMADWDSPIIIEYFNEKDRGMKLPETGSKDMIPLMITGSMLILAAILEKRRKVRNTL